MNNEQNHQVKQAEEQVRKIRHTLKELEGFGWKVNEPTKTLKAFDAQRAALNVNQAAIDTLSPLEKDHARKLKELLNEQTYIVETLASLARDGHAALTDEELGFFQAREKYLSNMAEETNRADEEASKALASLISALQKRWGVMLRRQELTQRFADISRAHNTPESFHAGTIQLPKPFHKMHAASWSHFIGAYFGRVLAVLPSMETTPSWDAAKTIYEKPVYIDIGHDDE